MRKFILMFTVLLLFLGNPVDTQAGHGGTIGTQNVSSEEDIQ